MSEKFRNRYRIQSTRAPWWDYAWNAAYFITICTRNRKHYFGEIVDGKMELSPVGVIADLMWYEIKNHSKNCQLGEFVIMPDHMHGILILQGNDLETDRSENDNSEMDCFSIPRLTNHWKTIPRLTNHWKAIPQLMNH